MTNRLLVYTMFFAFFVLNFGNISAQQTDSPYKINLKSGTFSPEKIVNVSTINEDSKYLMMQFEDLPTPSELKEQGISSLNYINPKTILVKVDEGTNLQNIANLRWAGKISSKDRISSYAKNTIENNPDIKNTFVVKAQLDINSEQLESIITNAGGIVSTNKSFPNYVRMCTGDKAVIESLQNLEEINWISVATPALKQSENAHYCTGAMTAYGPIGEFVVYGDGWDGEGLGSADLTYHFINSTNDISGDNEQEIIKKAFAEWSKYADIDFSETNLPNQNKSIDILWGSGEHGDGFAFDGPSNVLAHCFFPSPPNPEPIAGDMHFDEDEFWSEDSHINLFAVALHEAGHGLGLGHSDDPNAIMYAYYGGPVEGLRDDDIAAITSIYAERSNDNMPITLLSPINEQFNVSLSPTLDWSNVDVAISYNILLSTTSDFSSDIIVESANTNSIIINNLEEYHQYYWKVQAEKSGETGDWSEIFTFTTEGTPEITLLNPEKNAASIKKIVNFSWNKINGVQSYRIQISTDSLFTNPEINKSLTETTYTGNLLNNSKYFWRVYISLNGGSEAWSEIRKFETELINVVLSSPENAENGVVVTPTFDWLGSEGADSYTLQIANDLEFNSLVFAEDQITETTYTLSEVLDNNSKYFWRVKAHNSNSQSQWSSANIFTTIFSAPILISPNVASKNLVLQTKLVWENIDSVNYWLQVSKDSEFETMVHDKDNLTGSDYLLTDLEENEEYYWRVKSVNNSITSEWSEEWQFSTGAPPNKIDNDIISVSFVHDEGKIDQLKYKKGSAKDLVNNGFNQKFQAGLERIDNETKSKCISWQLKDDGVGIDSAVFIYTNSSYGTKTYTLKWSLEIGLEIDVDFDFSNPKIYNSTTYWKPGGNNASIYDSLMIINKNGQRVYKYISYPEDDETIYNDLALAAGFYDARFDEVAGYRFSEAQNVNVAQGKGKISLNNQYEGIGQQNIQFAVKNKDDFWEWSAGNNDPALAITEPQNGSLWSIGSTTTIKWTSTDIEDNVNIKLSSDGGKSFPIILAENIENDGSHSLQVPNNPSTESVLLIETVNDKSIFATSSGKFTISVPGAVNFIMPKGIISAPGQLVEVPFIIKPNGNNIGSFDAKISFNNDVLQFTEFINGNSITTQNGWRIEVRDSNEAGWIQVGAYANDKYFTTEETAVTFIFQVSYDALVGSTEDVLFETDHISAADSNAQYLDILSDNGSIIFHTMCAGKIMYYSNNEPIAGAKLKLVANNPDFTMTETSSSNGTYMFSPVKPGGSAVLSVDMENQVDMKPYITSGDALKAFRGREGGPNQLSPYEKIAANVNNDKIINSTDAYAILRRATGSFDDFSDFNLDDWAFIEASYKITQDNWNEAPTEVVFEPLNDISISKDLIAVIRGNVNGTYTNNPSNIENLIVGNKNELENSTGKSAHITLGLNQKSVAGEIIEVPVKIFPNGNKLGSLDFKVSFDSEKLSYVSHSSLGDVIPSDNKWMTDLYADSSGLISFAGFLSSDVTINHEGTVFIVKFRINENIESGETCEVGILMAASTDSLTNAINVIKNGMKVEIDTPTDIDTNVDNQIVTEYKLSQNYPNPFNPTTNIKFSLVNPGNVSIKIYNTIGQEVQTVAQEFFTKGIHTVTFNAKGLASGVYFYRIHVISENKSTDFVEVKRMILLK